jgi:hypothetical protein
MAERLRKDAPEGLRPAGVRAWTRALRAIERHGDPDLLLDAAARYAWAVDLADGARDTWLREGCVVTVTYPNGVEAPNPLLKVVREAELDAARFGKMLGIDATVKGKPGRPAEAVIRPRRRSLREELGVGPTPSAKMARKRRPAS